MLKSSSVSGEIYTQERTDGSQSDTALGMVGGGSKKRRSSLSARVVAIVGNRRSRSTSQISGPGELPWQLQNVHWQLSIPLVVCDINVANFLLKNMMRTEHPYIYLGAYLFDCLSLSCSAKVVVDGC